MLVSLRLFNVGCLAIPPLRHGQLHEPHRDSEYCCSGCAEPSHVELQRQATQCQPPLERHPAERESLVLCKSNLHRGAKARPMCERRVGEQLRQIIGDCVLRCNANGRGARPNYAFSAGAGPTASKSPTGSALAPDILSTPRGCAKSAAIATVVPGAGWEGASRRPWPGAFFAKKRSPLNERQGCARHCKLWHGPCGQTLLGARAEQRGCLFPCAECGDCRATRFARTPRCACAAPS